jgi:hypothetical protein
MWRIENDEQGRDKKELCKEMKGLLEGLNGKIPGLIKAEVGINNLDDVNSYDVVFVSDFESKFVYEDYSKHPEHAKIVPFFRELKLARAIVDYEVQ